MKNPITVKLLSETKEEGLIIVREYQLLWKKKESFGAGWSQYQKGFDYLRRKYKMNVKQIVMDVERFTFTTIDTQF